MKKKKILFIGRFPPPVHGAAVMNELYFNEIKDNSNFCVKRIKVNYPEKTEKIGKINLGKFFWNLFLPINMKTKLLFFNPKLVYFEIAPNGLAFYRDSLLVLIAKFFRKRVIFHLHARNLTNNKYSKFIFKNTKIIVLSNLLYSEVKNFYKKEDIFILPNGIPDKGMNKLPKSIKRDNELRILFISNMIEEKGARDALKVAENLAGKIKFKMKFAGPWNDVEFKEKWENYLKEKKLENYCEYVGPKYGEDKDKLFENTDILIFPTTYKNESFPVVVLEAFRAGIPVVAYDNGAIKEMLSEKYLGKAVGKGDIKSLTQAIQEIKLNNSSKIRKNFINKYEIGKISKRLINILGVQK